jgi:hypothetical protein
VAPKLILSRVLPCGYGAQRVQSTPAVRSRLKRFNSNVKPQTLRKCNEA